MLSRILATKEVCVCFPTILQVDVSDCFVLCHGRFKVCELCQTSSQMEVGADFVSCLLALSKAFNILQPRNCVEWFGDFGGFWRVVKVVLQGSGFWPNYSVCQVMVPSTSNSVGFFSVTREFQWISGSFPRAIFMWRHLLRTNTNLNFTINSQCFSLLGLASFKPLTSEPLTSVLLSCDETLMIQVWNKHLLRVPQH